VITYPFTHAGVTSALTALGKTPNRVAANLSALGFRGAQADCDDCPLVHYLKAVFPSAHTVRVSQTAVHLVAGFGDDSVDLEVEHTVPTGAFVQRFDNADSDYPDLIEENAHA
jgi:hypothetical protein